MGREKSGGQAMYRLTRGTHLITHARDRVLTYHAIGLTATGTLGLDALSCHGFDLFRHAGGVVLDRW